MTFTASIAVCALLSLLFFVAAVRQLRVGRVGGGVVNAAIGLLLILGAVCALLVAANLRSYQRLGAEQPAGELQFSRAAQRDFYAVLSYPDGERDSFELRGDEWLIDARILKWRAFANLVGFDAVYRLERISGRYSHIEDERNLPRTVYDLHRQDHVDVWEFAHLYHSLLPWVDALYGSATFLPMADGALYEIKVSQTGLLARPLNQAARDAVSGWHE